MKQLFNSIKIIGIALVIGLGVSYVSAAPWSAPGAAPTGGNTVASVNVSDYAQTKIGSFITENFLKAGGAISPTGAPWNKAGYAVAEKAFISPWSFFTSAFLPGSSSQVKIGGGDDATTDIFNAAVTPFTIDLAGRGSGVNSVSGRQTIDIRTDTLECYPNATIRTNTPAVRLLNSKTGDDADAIVRGVQLSGGNPAPGKILVSTDRYGNAIWGTPTLSGGQIVFTYGTSPAATGQALCSNPPQPPTDLCQNINEIQTTLPLNMVQDGVNCICDDGYNLVGGVCEPIEIPEPGIFAIGCFLENTQVTLANGSKKDIEDIKIGDQLKAVSGINTVQKLLRPKLGNQLVYSINKSEEFFTANHPFLTTDGWKSIDPETTKKEIPDLFVTKMNIGDTLVTENRNIIITSITSKTVSPNTQLYNFELDGDHTYYANGYAVHNKEQVPSNNPNPSCDLDPSTLRSDCTELNNYYCSISTGNTQGQCIKSYRCTQDSDCASGPTLGNPPDQIQLVNGRCVLPTSWVHPADQGKKFCKW